MGLSVFDETYPLIAARVFVTTGLQTGAPIPMNLSQSQRIDRLRIVSNDTIDHTVQVWYNSYNSDMAWIGTISVPTLAGTDPTIPAVDLLVELGFNDNGLVLGPLDMLTLIDPVAISAAKTVWVTSMGGAV
jgi:hypothetical protein